MKKFTFLSDLLEKRFKISATDQAYIFMSEVDKLIGNIPETNNFFVQCPEAKREFLEKIKKFYDVNKFEFSQVSGYF